MIKANGSADMKDDSRATPIARLEALGGCAIALHYPGMSLALLDEIVAALAEAESPPEKKGSSRDRRRREPNALAVIVRPQFSPSRLESVAEAEIETLRRQR
jgi:hypothetical protein